MGGTTGVIEAVKEDPAVESHQEQTAQKYREEAVVRRRGARETSGRGVERHSSSAERRFQPQDGEATWANRLDEGSAKAAASTPVT